MNEECLLHIERAAEVFIASERREPKRFEKAILAVSMAIPNLTLSDDLTSYEAIPNLDSLLRFKSTMSDLHHRIVTDKTTPDRRLTEIVMAMGYDHLANYFLGCFEQEIHEELSQTTQNVFTSIRRKVGAFVREARAKLQDALASGGYRLHFCRNCSSQAFVFPKVIQRDHMRIPDMTGECYLCHFKGKVRMCTSCPEPFFPSAAASRDGSDDPQQLQCTACRGTGSTVRA